MFSLRRTERAKRSCKPALEQLDVRVVPQASPFGVVSPIQTPPRVLEPPGTPVNPNHQLFVKFDENGSAVAALRITTPAGSTQQIYVPLRATTGPDGTLAYVLPVAVTPGDVRVESLSGGVDAVSDVLRFTSVENPTFNGATYYLEVFSDPGDNAAADHAFPANISPFAPTIFEDGIPQVFEEANYQPTSSTGSESTYVFFSDGTPFSVFTP